jgi:hypothetical protein
LSQSGRDLKVRRTIDFALKYWESYQTGAIDHDVGTSMSVGEIVLYTALLIWGPPLIVVGFLMRPSRRRAD